MAIPLSDNLAVGQRKPADDREYNNLNPYENVVEANATIPPGRRFIGLTVYVKDPDNPTTKVIEYWYQGGLADVNLIRKIPDVIPVTKTSDLTNDGEDGSSPYATEEYVDDLTNELATALEGKADLVLGKVPQSQSQPSNIAYNSVNGVITFTDATGTITTIDLPIENLFQNASYNSTTKILTLTTNGGGTINIDLSTLVDLPEVVIAATNPGGSPSTGQKLYFNTTNGQYWMNSSGTWITPGAPLQLGETSATAYRGDRGKTAYDHSQIIAGNPHNTTKADVGLSNVDNTSDATKPVSTVQAAAIAAAVAPKENSANKQNSLAADGTGAKFPTVDALNGALTTINSNVTGKEDVSNKTQNLGTSATLYPSQAALDKGINKEIKIVNTSTTGYSAGTYTIQTTDKNFWLLFDFTSATNILFPNTGTAIGDEWEAISIGAGQLSFTTSGGSVINKPAGSLLKTFDQGSPFGVKKTANATFSALGRLEQVQGEEIKNSENTQSITATPVSPLVLTDFGTNGGLIIYVNATAGAVTITLPLASTWAGKILTIIKIDSTINSVTVKGSGSELINAVNTDVLNTQYQTKSYRSSGTQNYIF